MIYPSVVQFFHFHRTLEPLLLWAIPLTIIVHLLDQLSLFLGTMHSTSIWMTETR
jgi:hypothetical protein